MESSEKTGAMSDYENALIAQVRQEGRDDIIIVLRSKVKAIENEHATPGCWPSAYSGFEECRYRVLKTLEKIEVKSGSCQTRIAELEQELAVGNALTAKLTDQCRELENKLRVKNA